MRYAFPIVLGVLGLAPALPAQTTTPAVEPGARVMLVTGRGYEERRLVGRVVSVDSAAVRLESAKGETLSVPSSTVRQAYRSAGGTPRSTTAAKGAVVGLIVGGMIGYGAGDDCSDDSFICFDRSETTPFGAMAGAGLGALLGGLVGGERWTRVSLPARASLDFLPPGPVRGGIQLATLRF